MQTARPLSDRWSVSFAGLVLVALAAGSFTSGLLRQMNVPSPDHSAQVVVMPPKDAPPPTSMILAQTLRPAPAPAAPAREPDRPRRRSAPREPTDTAPESLAAPEPALAAAGAASEAATIEPTAPTSQLPEPPPAGAISP